MTKIIMHGASGFMGKVVGDLCESDPNAEVVAGVDINTAADRPYPIYSSLDEVKEAADVIVDFSHVSAIDALLDYCGRTGMPVVLCTTGLSDAQLSAMRELSKKSAVLKSANMSLGINTIMELLKKAASVFAPAGFDIEIVEKHHNRKLDAPSGTALALADSINDAMGNKYEYVYDRSLRREKRHQDEIGISAVRGGSIVGDHDVIFAGPDEVITISHSAYSRGVFAKGAIEAARFLKGKGPGLYDMADVIAAK